MASMQRGHFLEGAKLFKLKLRAGREKNRPWDGGQNTGKINLKDRHWW